MLTNILKIACVLSLFTGIVGCDDDAMTTGTNQDFATAGVQDLATSAGNDLSKASDGGSGGDGGLKALCAPCTTDGECESGSCLPYMGGQKKLCSHSCAMATAATNCPGIGACNGQAECKCQ